MGDEANRAEFSVCQFFPDGTYEYVCRWQTAEQAFKSFLCCIAAAKVDCGIARVIITDGGDMTNAEWTLGEGLTYPKPKDFVPAKGSKPD